MRLYSVNLDVEGGLALLTRRLCDIFINVTSLERTKNSTLLVRHHSRPDFTKHQRQGQQQEQVLAQDRIARRVCSQACFFGDERLIEVMKR